MIKLTAKGLAKFMTAGESRKRKILRDYKHRDPEGFVQANYYREARDTIRRFLKGECNQSSLTKRAASLRADALTSSGPTMTRLRNNARAIAQFARHLPTFPCEVLADVKGLYVEVDGVRVSASPDIHARLGNREVLIRFEFSAQPQSGIVPRIMCQLMADACKARGINIAPKDCLYVDVPRNVIHRRAKARARTTSDIGAACRNIAAIWPTIQKDEGGRLAA